MKAGAAILMVLAAHYLFLGAVVLADEDHFVRIRIRNELGFDLTNVVMDFPDGPLAYGPIKNGEVSKYCLVIKSLPYAKYDAFVGTKKFVYPTDGAWCTVGDSFLDKGFYTFAIFYNQGGELDIRCEDDSKR